METFPPKMTIAIKFDCELNLIFSVFNGLFLRWNLGRFLNKWFDDWTNNNVYIPFFVSFNAFLYEKVVMICNRINLPLIAMNLVLVKFLFKKKKTYPNAFMLEAS